MALKRHLTILLLVLATHVEPVGAGVPDFATVRRTLGKAFAGFPKVVTTRRAVGAAFIGTGIALTVQGFSFRDEADRFYDDYQRAVDPVEIERLYERTSNRDIKAQVSWALAAAFGISGTRLLLTKNPDPPGGRDEETVTRRARLTTPASAHMQVIVEPLLTPRNRQVTAVLKKPFF